MQILDLRENASEESELARSLLWKDASKRRKGREQCWESRSNMPGSSPSGIRRRKAMYALSVFAITPYLWRWEIRRGGALLRCGTAPTQVTAEMAVRDVINT
jgi:hypothetical protein